MALDFGSPYYPYSAVPQANNTLLGAEEIPYKILTYLLDLPDSNGYTPVDDNSRPRVRFIKYLYYNSTDPLSAPLPTTKQKLSLLYDPEHPAINTNEEKKKHPKGYRLFWQHVRKQSILEEQSFVKCYLGRVFDPKVYHTTIGIRFDIWCGTLLETNMKTNVESRSFAIEQAIRNALAPINMTGIGAISFNRYDHTDNGSTPIYTEGAIVGRSLHCSIDWTDSVAQEVDSFCSSCE